MIVELKNKNKKLKAANPKSLNSWFDFDRLGRNNSLFFILPLLNGVYMRVLLRLSGLWSQQRRAHYENGE